MSKGKLSADFIKANNVAFAPKTVKEAEAIQRWLFRHNIIWGDNKAIVAHTKECLEYGMIVKDGKLYWNNGKVAGVAARISDLGKFNKNDYLTPEERTQAKIDRLEREVKTLHAKIDMLVMVLKPANLEKPALVAKKAGRTP